MGRRATKIRHRTASYGFNNPVSTTSMSSFGVSSKGFSFTFSHNWSNWSKYAEATKKRMATIMLNKVKQASDLIAEEARRRCPHYSGALEDAIAVSEPNIVGGITARGYVEMAVGVLSSWKSAYDKVANAVSEPVNPITDSGPELAMYIHELYDTFIYDTVAGLERKRRKEAVSGRVVGSHFLSRAYTENNATIRSIFTTWRGSTINSDEEVPF